MHVIINTISENKRSNGIEKKKRRNGNDEILKIKNNYNKIVLYRWEIKSEIEYCYTALYKSVIMLDS